MIQRSSLLQAITQRYSRQVLENNWLDFAVNHFDPLWSMDQIKAEVVSFQDETADIRRIVLRPNRNWKGFVAGQFVTVRVPVDGVFCERCYSLTSDPAEGLIEIAVKKQPHGKVSTWLHEQLEIGQILSLGDVGGEFVLPQTLTQPVLMLAGGSGITPMYSLTRALLKRQPAQDVVLMYYVNRPEDLAFASELKALAAQHSGLRWLAITAKPSAEAAAQGHFTLEQLQTLCPDWQSRQAFLCGPAPMMSAVSAVWAEQGLGAQLLLERFGSPAAPASAASQGQAVTLRRSQLQFAHEADSLLESAEAAGARPAYGCRMGMCKQCTCTKVSGTVRDRITGVIDANPNTAIRLCISEPLTAVELDI